MHGVVLASKKRVDVREFPDPYPGPNEVVIETKASALCRSDLSTYHGESVLEEKDEKKEEVIILGHEPCGIVKEIGPNVKDLEEGERVAVYLAIGCSHCKYCRSGYFMLCPKRKCIGDDVHGGNADLLLVPAENCLKIPEGMSFVEGALSTDKVGTLYHAVKRLGISGRDKVAIFGVGPMGSVGALIAKAFGAVVYVVDSVESRLYLMNKLGIDQQIDASQYDPVKVIQDLTKGEGVDVAIDCSGNPIAENNALNSVKKLGRVAFIGESKKLVIDPSNQLI
ncbi:unnamed protein product, partial [marine sediment metagenome]